MANIMMTDVCNLRCPYCFANEFVNKDTNEISEENFNRAVDFIVVTAVTVLWGSLEESRRYILSLKNICAGLLRTTG